MRKFNRRTFMKGAGAVGAAAAIPFAAKVALADQAAVPLSSSPVTQAAPEPMPSSQGVGGDAPRSSVSVAERVVLPFGVWVGLGINPGGKGVVEVDYYGYERFFLASGTEIAGNGGFYRIIATVEFPARNNGRVVADHLLVYDTDRIAPGVKPLSVVPLPKMISALAQDPVQIRDLSLDLCGGLFGDWHDADELLTSRLRRRFEREAHDEADLELALQLAKGSSGGGVSGPIPRQLMSRLGREVQTA